MPFARPTLSQIRSAIAADISSGVPGADGLLRFSNLGVTGKALAGGVHGHYGYLDWIAKQAVPFTAEAEYLEGWAALKGVFRKPPEPAVGPVLFTGAVGTVLPAGTQMTRGDGTVFVVDVDATADAGGNVAATVVATIAAASGNSPVGTVLTLTSGLQGIASIGAASSALTGGADLETDDNLRSRMLAAYAAPAQGGDSSDYVEWALAVAGVTRAWVQPLGMGPGTVVVRFMMDAAEAAAGGFPQGTDGVSGAETRAVAATGDQVAVANAIFAAQPVTALVYVAAPTRNTVSFTIAGLGAASAATKAAVSAAIDQVFLTQGAPGGVVDLSYIEAAIAALANTTGFVITAIACDNGAISLGATGNISCNVGRLPVRGAITWI